MANNIYGVILAGGKGTRMGNVERPKQFMEVGGKPIIVHTIEKFAIHTEFDKIFFSGICLTLPCRRPRRRPAR